MRIKIKMMCVREKTAALYEVDVNFVNFYWEM